MTSPSWVRTMPDSFWPPDNLTLVSALQQLPIIPHLTHRHWGRRWHGQASQSWHLRRVQGSKEAGQAQEGTKDIQWPLRRHFCPKWTFWIRKIDDPFDHVFGSPPCLCAQNYILLMTLQLVKLHHLPSSSHPVKFEQIVSTTESLT